MTLDYRTMAGSDWAVLVVIILLCLLVAGLLAFRPQMAWRSTQRWRAPGQSEEDLGEPTRGFRIACRVFAVVVLLLGGVCVLSPFMPAILGR